MKLIRAQLEKILSAKLDEMLSLQKSTFDRIGLGYGLPSSNIASTSITVFVPPANNVKIENNEIKIKLASENLDKGKSILGAPLKLDKKETKNSRAKKGNTQKSKWLAIGHTRSNCYKWLATQQSNSMISSGNQNEFPSSFASFGDLLKALMFLLNLNGFNSSPSPLNQGFTKWKGFSKVWKEKGFK